MDYVLDVIFCVLSELVKLIKPNAKLKRWQEISLVFLSTLWVVGTIAVIIVGVHIMCNYPDLNALGVALLVVGCASMLAFCILDAVLIGLHFKAQAKNDSDGSAE